MNFRETDYSSLHFRFPVSRPVVAVAAAAVLAAALAAVVAVSKKQILF